MAISRDKPGWRGEPRTSSALAMSGLLAGLLALSGAVQAEEEREWPRGHYPLPEEGNVIGERYIVIVEDHEDTLIDIARRHNLGYEEIVRANPEVSIWIPGEGTEVKIPGQFILPEAERTGVVINIAAQRLHHDPEVAEGETPRVETYPGGIGRGGYATRPAVSPRMERGGYQAGYPPRSMREE